MSRRMKSKLARWEREVKPDRQPAQTEQLTQAQHAREPIDSVTTSGMSTSARKRARKREAKKKQAQRQSESLSAPTQALELKLPIPKQPKQQQQPKSSKNIKNAAQAQERKQRKRAKRADQARKVELTARTNALPLRPAVPPVSPILPSVTSPRPRVWLSTVAKSTTRRIDPNYETRSFPDDPSSSNAMDVDYAADQAAVSQAEEDAYQAACDAVEAEKIARVEEEDEQADAWREDWQKNNLVNFCVDEDDPINLLRED